MDAETLNEFGQIVISIIVTVFLIAVMTGSVFMANAKEMIDNSGAEHEQHEYINDSAFREYIIGGIE